MRWLLVLLLLVALAWPVEAQDEAPVAVPTLVTPDCQREYQEGMAPWLTCLAGTMTPPTATLVE